MTDLQQVIAEGEPTQRDDETQRLEDKALEDLAPGEERGEDVKGGPCNSQGICTL